MLFIYSSESVVLYFILLSDSHRFYHVIISTSTREKLNNCEGSRKQGLALNSSMKSSNNNIWDLRKSIVTTACCYCYDIAGQSERFFSLQWKASWLSALQLLGFPPSTVSHCKMAFMPLWTWHAGNTNEPRLAFRWQQCYCGTLWEEMMAEGK